MIKKIFIGVLLVLFGLPVGAAEHYILDGGSGDGTSWSSPLDTLPETLTRGDTYYIGEGAYGSYTFDDAGTTTIYIKKATATDHGVGADWSDSMGDSAATWTKWTFETTDYELDGQVGQWASDMSDYVAYGFKVFSQNTGDNQEIIESVSGSDDIVIRHVEAYYSTTPRSGTWYKTGMILAKYGGDFELYYSWLHDGSNGIYNGYFTSVLFDHCVLERNGQGQVAMGWDPSEHSEIIGHKATSACTVRYSHIRDWRSTGGLIAMDVNSPSLILYGNVFTETDYWSLPSETNDSNGVINGLGESSGITILAYNNTFVDISYGASIATEGSYASRIVTNNIFHNCERYNYGTPSTLSIGGTHTYNRFYDVIGDFSGETGYEAGNVDEFVNKTNDDFHLSEATGEGDVTIGATYNTDMDGVTRGADGVWDRGAYEYDAGGGEPSIIKKIMTFFRRLRG